MSSTRQKTRIAMLTPWEQICGNAEYAKRLVRGLSSIAEITPHEMQNIGDGYDEEGQLITRRDLNRRFKDLVHAVNESDAEIVHVQHEFGFFGRSIREADERFLDLVEKIDRPVVVTLHTFLPAMLRGRPARRSAKALEFLSHWWRTRKMRRSLRRTDAIILHSLYTQRLLIRAFPELRKKIHVVPIAIETFPPSKAGKWVKVEGDRWIVLPGFVSSYKGHDYALAALKLLPKTHKLVVAGGLHPKDSASAETWMALLGKADEFKVRDRLVFTGFLEDPGEQAEIFEKADLFLLPYNEVGQSGSAALADVMAYGRPVVTSFAKSMFVYRMDRDTVNSTISVDVGNPKLLASCILNCLESDRGQHDAEHLATASARYDLKNTTSNYETIYLSVLRL